MQFRTTIGALAAALCLGLAVSTARAADGWSSPRQMAPSDSHRGTSLTARVDEMDVRIRELRRELAEIDGRPIDQSGVEQTSANVPLPAPAISDYVPPASTGYAPMPVEKALAEKPKYPTVTVTGFFQADAGWIHQSPNNIDAVGDVQDGADFRRTRLAAKGDVWDNVAYMIEMDFAFPGRPSFMDVYLDIKNVGGLGTFRFGQYRQPFSMDAMTSVRELMFLERALPLAFVPFRQIGAGFFHVSEDESSTCAVAAFRYPTDFYGGNVGDNNGYGTTARMTKVLMYNEPCNHLLHLGANVSYIDPSNDLARFRNQPEFFVSETPGAPGTIPPGELSQVPFFVDTGDFDASNISLFGAEFAGANGSFYFQSEAICSVVHRIGPGTTAFSGGYASAAYLLTGEHRPYNKQAGAFGRVKPLKSLGKEGGCGAWEVAARWSYLDLNDDDIRGGRLNDVTFGVNWYLNPFTKFQFNYIYAMLDDPVEGPSVAGITAIRGQLDF